MYIYIYYRGEGALGLAELFGLLAFGSVGGIVDRWPRQLGAQPPHIEGNLHQGNDV